MRGMRGPLGLLALTAALLVSAFGASSAQAAFGIARWEALTCTENTDTPLVFGEQLVGFPPAQSPFRFRGGFFRALQWRLGWREPDPLFAKDQRRVGVFGTGQRVPPA